MLDTHKEDSNNNLSSSSACVCVCASAREDETKAKAAALTAELSELMKNDMVEFQIRQKTRIAEADKIRGYVKEFTEQLALEGRTEEKGWRLVLHCANWLNIKKRYERERERESDLNEQARRHRDEVNDLAGALMRGDIKIF